MRPSSKGGSSELWSTNTWEENVVSVEPFEAEYSYTIEDETLTVTIDDDLSIVDVTTSTTPETS